MPAPRLLCKLGRPEAAARAGLLATRPPEELLQNPHLPLPRQETSGVDDPPEAG